jgi:SCF-associated factor 1
MRVRILCRPYGSGDVYVWWPFWGTLGEQYEEVMVELDKDGSTKVVVPDGRTVIPCHALEIKKDPVKLPVLPDLPDLPATELPEEERRRETKLIKIAGLDEDLVGLTNKGHVLKLDGLYDEDCIRTWHYVSKSARTI